MEIYYGKYAAMWRWLWLHYCTAVAIVALSVTALAMGAVDIFVIAFFSISIPFLLSLRQYAKIERYRKDLSERFWDVAEDIKDRSHDFYGVGKGTPLCGWKEAAVECHEAHIPGDCPLCGAE